MASSQIVRVHPVVLFSIVDSFERRNADAKRVIGTLLGNSDKTGVEITNCFCVPHNESEEEVAVDMEFARNMYELHKRVNPSEVIVGWYATGSEITEHSVLIHEYYARECKDPVHLTVDTTMADYHLSLKAYVSASMGVPGKTLGTMFTPMPLKVVGYEMEKVGLNVIQMAKLSRTRDVPMTSDLLHVNNNTVKMLDMLDTVIAYVSDVIAGKSPADSTIGRHIMEMVCKIPQLEEEEFEEMLNSNMKDLLMMVYLSHLTTHQLVLNEKLNCLPQQEKPGF